MPLSRFLCRCGAGGVRISYPDDGCTLSCLECKETVSAATNDEALAAWNQKNTVTREGGVEESEEE